MINAQQARELAHDASRWQPLVLEQILNAAIQGATHLTVRVPEAVADQIIGMLMVAGYIAAKRYGIGGTISQRSYRGVEVQW